MKLLHLAKVFVNTTILNKFIFLAVTYFFNL